jgi:hypothetical protein
MNDLATRTAAPLVLATTKRLGVEVPKPLADALARVDRLRNERRTIDDTPDVTAAVAAAIWAGKDPLTSKEVQRAALATQLKELNIGHRLGDYADQHAAAALVEHADALIEAWRPVVEKADQVLRRFRELVPGVDPLHPDLPAGLPTAALTPWGEAREAAAQLEQLGKGWQALAGAGAAYIPQNSRPLIVADLTLDQLEQLGTNAKCDAVASLDVSLDLASPSTFTERVQKIAQARGEQQAWNDAAPERAREERRQTLGIVRIPAASRTP